MIGPDGRHALTLGQSATAVTFDLTQNGFYEVQRVNGRRALMAVHTDRRESDLTPAPAENLALWVNTGVTATGNVSTAEQAGTSELQTRPWSLWRYALGLVLIAALIEWFFGSRYLKEERRTA